MKLHPVLSLCAFALLVSSRALAAPGDEHHDVVLDPAEGKIAGDTVFTVSFAEPMVATSAINAGDVPSPIVSQPKLDAVYLWKSVTDGELTVKAPLIPNTHYRVSTAPGLKDAKGHPVPSQKWEFDSDPFEITTEEEQRDALAQRPHFALNANYPVSLLDAADYVYFQDRDSHERLPAEILIEPDQSAAEGTSFTVAPRLPLPMGRTFDVVVNGLCEARTHAPLSYLRVFPAGETSPIEIDWLGAFNDPLDKPLIRIKFTEKIDPDSVTPDVFTLTPPITNLKVRAEEDEVVIEGGFDIKQHYSVVTSPAIKGIRGFGLAEPSKWGATFHPKESTIIFPQGEVFQRSASGFKFSLLQVNTGPLTWTLSEVPLDKLPAVAERVRQYKQGETPLELKVVGRGQFDANADAEEVLREIDWHPPQPLSGAYLFEASATDADGDKQANRTLVCFSEYLLTQKRSNDQVVLRVARMNDGLGAPNLTVRAVTGENLELGRAVTDASGLAVFPVSQLLPQKTPANLFIVDTPAGPAIQYVEGPRLMSADFQRSDDAGTLRALLVTDRNLYRPGQTVKIHGVLRVEQKGALALPQFHEVAWKIKNEAGDAVTDGSAAVSNHGGWDAEWTIPTTLPTGLYRLNCNGPGIGAPEGAGAEISVEEYRVPLFSVDLEEGGEAAPASEIKVASTYFHGAPNAKAKVHWKAVWSVAQIRDDNEDNFVRTDAYSENHLESDEEKSAEGDAFLDANGTAVLRCEPPFNDGRKRGRCSVQWTVDVTSAEAQTITAGAECVVQTALAWAGIRADTKAGAERTITVESQAIDVHDKPVNGTAVRLDLFHVTTKTVKEKIAPFLVRYRNSTTYEKIASRAAVTPAKIDFPVEKTGEYVAVVIGPGGVPASTSVTVSGDEQAELPVENDTDIAVSLPEPARPYQPGETVPLSVQAPFGGVAWVSVEAGEILDTFIVPLRGNAGRIDLPVKKEYAPDATVIVYLVQPGGENRLPRERIGQVRLQIARPDRDLVVTPKFDAPSVRPGAPVRGQITVTSENHPIAGADFVVFAVDDAVLQLGGWEMPDAKAIFYPERGHGVTTFAALSRFVERIDRRSLLEKGYVVGDGGEGQAGSVSAVRKEFKTLAYWESKLTTDAQGRIPFEFTAPDNLTSYRLIAIGETDANQFGGGSATVAVSKPLLCESALPRFVRVGDEVRLRAVARQKVAKDAHITVRCITEGLDLLDDKPITESAPQDIPAVFSFPARVRDESSAVKVRFEATSDIGETDAVEVSLPVRPPTVLRKETVSATVRTPAFSVADIAPKLWQGSRGAFDVTLSTSPWIAKLNGLPAILEYPHGCFEQISSRVLAYATMTDLLASLPDDQERDANYHAMLASSMKLYQGSILDNGMLPYWPGQETPNYFVTVLASWAIHESANVGVEIPPKLSASLDEAVQKIIKDEGVHADLVIRALALMVTAGPGAAGGNANVAQDLYLKRDSLNDEGRAILAIALHKLDIMPKEKAQLLKEIAKPVAERAFDPDTFSSTTRAEALITLAFADIAPNGPQIKQRRDRLLTLLDNSVNFSTEENLWLLLAFKAMHDAQPLTPLKPAGLTPLPALAAKNGTGVAWPRNDLAALAKFKIDGLPTAAPLTCLVSAEYRTEKPETDRSDRGLRVERVVRDLTDPKRTGETTAPFKLGDQLLVTYRLLSRNLNDYVALEDLLPAGFETVNPDLPLISKTYQLPRDPSGRELDLSHSDLRDDETCLYFDRIEPGAGSYSVLARATTAGTFHWPATRAAPMYDSRFTGLSASSSCVVSE